MRKLSYKDEGSWKLLAVAMGLECLSLVGGAGNGVLPRSLLLNLSGGCVHEIFVLAGGEELGDKANAV